MKAILSEFSGTEAEIIEELSKPCMRKFPEKSVYDVLSGTGRPHERKAYI